MSRQSLGKKVEREADTLKAIGKKLAGRIAHKIGQKARASVLRYSPHWLTPVAASALEGAGLTAGLGKAESMHTEQNPKKNYRLQLKNGGKKKRNNPKAYFPVGHSRPDGGRKARPDH